MRTNIAIYSYALLRIHIVGQRSVRVAPPSLSPHHSDPATRDLQSSILVEVLQGVIWMCRASFPNRPFPSSAMVQYCGLLPVDWVVVLPRVLHYSRLLRHPPLAGILMFLQSCLQSPSGLPDVDLASSRDTIYYIGLLSKR